MHKDNTYRTPRPHRVITFIDFNADGSVDTTDVTQEFGRRAGLNTRRSDVSDRRRRANRKDRRIDRQILRRNLDVELSRGGRGSAIYFVH